MVSPDVSEDPADNDTLEAQVLASYHRCSTSLTFFDDFYVNVMNMSAQIKEKFAHTDLAEQKRKVRQALTYVILFSMGSLSVEDQIKKISQSHSRKELDIPPVLYGLWVDALMTTVAKHDQQLTPELEPAWRSVIEKTIKIMKDGYQAT